MKKQQQAYPLRLPDDLREYLKEKSVVNGRSLNSEIVQRLKESKEMDEGKQYAAHQ